MNLKPRVYVLTTNGKDVLKTVRSVTEHLEVVLFDNRHPLPDPAGWESRQLLWDIQTQGHCIRTPVEMTYSQLHNWAQMIESNRDSLAGHPNFYFTMHDDCWVTEPDKLPDLIRWIENAGAGQKWWCAYTEYDSLCAWNMEAFDDVGLWDQTLPLYFCDFDNYARFTAAGYTNFQTPFAHIVHHEKNQTYKSDPRREFLNGITFPLYKSYFEQKWGGHPAKFTKPFDGKLPHISGPERTKDDGRNQGFDPEPVSPELNRPTPTSLATEANGPVLKVSQPHDPNSFNPTPP